MSNTFFQGGEKSSKRGETLPALPLVTGLMRGESYAKIFLHETQLFLILKKVVTTLE